MRLDVTVLAAVATLATAGCASAQAEPAQVQPLEPGVEVSTEASATATETNTEVTAVRTEAPVASETESALETVEVQSIVAVPDAEVVVEPASTLHDMGDSCPACGRG